MRVGVAGCGYWGSKHARVLESLGNVDRVVAIEPNEESRELIANSFPQVATFQDLAAARTSIDALIVATPPRAHFPVAMDAIGMGKHVLVEKPLTTSSDDARRMIDAAQDAGVVLMVGHTFEYNAAVWRLREAMRGGELGDVYYIDAARLNLGLYQPDVNVVWDLAPHDISILNYLLDCRPSGVDARAYSCADCHFVDVAYVNLEYADVGVDAHVHVSWLDPCKVRRLTVVGSKKMAVYNDVATEEKLRIYDKGVDLPSDPFDRDTPSVPLSYRYGSIVSPYIDFREPLRIEDEHFVDCVKAGATPATDGQNGLAVVAVLEAAERSIRERRPVALGLEVEAS